MSFATHRCRSENLLAVSSVIDIGHHLLAQPGAFARDYGTALSESHVIRGVEKSSLPSNLRDAQAHLSLLEKSDHLHHAALKLTQGECQISMRSQILKVRISLQA